MDHKDEIAKELNKLVPLKPAEITGLLEVPPAGLGDFAFPCFSLAKVLRKNPAEIAADVAKKVKLGNVIEKVEVKGGYVNFFINKGRFADEIIMQTLKEKDGFGSGESKGMKVLIEYPSPNTNKPLHLGHVRNMLLGKSLSNILRFSGYGVVQTNLNNDRGVHICKAMLAYTLWGKSKLPDKKSDHFVGGFYVKYAQNETPEMESQIHEMLGKWESGDKETVKLWKKINGWALKGFKETYARLGVKFDKEYFESEIYRGGKDIVLDAFKKGVFKKDDKGNIVAPLEKFGLPDKVVLRADGTSIYITQDINLAKLKYSDFKMDKSIYVVGSEQELHFRQLFKTLELLGFSKVDGCYHLSYGMVYLPEGRMKSREGKVVDADNLMDDMVNLAEKEIRARHSIAAKELKKRAEMIGLGALRFFILKYDPLKDFVFNPEESLSFEGDTGPYVQYAYARICSVLRKSKAALKGADLGLLKEAEEQEMIALLGRFPEVVSSAADKYKPSLVANYVLKLAQQFNEYYHKHQILKADSETMKARLLLITAVRQVLKSGLNLLGIDAPERM